MFMTNMKFILKIDVKDSDHLQKKNVTKSQCDKREGIKIAKKKAKKQK